MPVNHRSNSTQIISTLSTRRASPLSFKIIKFNNKYKWMLLRFAGEFLPEGEVLTVKNHNKNHNKRSKPDYSLIDEFWNKTKENANAQEIILSMPEKLNKLVNSLKLSGAKK